MSEDELRVDTDDAKACAPELEIAACIRGALASENGAIDFDDELAAGSAEVGNESAGDGRLAPKETPSRRTLIADHRSASRYQNILPQLSDGGRQCAMLEGERASGLCSQGRS